MRAIVITGPGSPEVLAEVDRPSPRPGPSQVRVRVHASALNRADVLQRKGAYPAPAGAPADIPGLEYAGEVDAIGPGAGLWAPGSRVMGIVGGGAHAEYLCVHEMEAIRIPGGMDWVQAAAVPEAFLTAHDALHRQLQVQAGEQVLIHAVGSGVGTAGLQLARAAGAITVGTSRTPSKLKRALELGLDHAVDASTAEWVDRVARLAGEAGIQAILDLVGGPYLVPNLRLLGHRGRSIVIGMLAGRTAEIDLGVLLRKRLRLLGSVLRSRPLEEKIELARDFSDNVLPLFASGSLTPVVDRTYSFGEIAAAHRRMESNESFGKIVLLW